MRNRALFLDRDGVINKPIIKDGRISFLGNLDELHILPNVDRAIAEAKKLGLLVIIFTNQPDIARGALRKEDAEEIHSYLTTKLSIDDVYMCPHDDADNCTCRKPKHGMLSDAAVKWNIELKKSFVVGDRWKDIKAGKLAGCTTFLIDSNYYNENIEIDYDHCVSDLYSAV